MGHLKSQQQSQYRLLLQALSEQGRGFEKVLSHWSVDNLEEVDDFRIRRSLERVVDGPVRLEGVGVVGGEANLGAVALSQQPGLRVLV